MNDSRNYWSLYRRGAQFLRLSMGIRMDIVLYMTKLNIPNCLLKKLSEKELLEKVWLDLA